MVASIYTGLTPRDTKVNIVLSVTSENQNSTVTQNGDLVHQVQNWGSKVVNDCNDIKQ